MEYFVVRNSEHRHGGTVMKIAYAPQKAKILGARMQMTDASLYLLVLT